MLLGYFIFVFPIVAIISALIYIPFFMYIRRRSGKQTFLFHLVRYAFIGCCLSLLYLTILWYYPDITFHPNYYFLNLRPFVWLTEVYAMGAKKMAEQLVLNIGMFIPYGLLLTMSFRGMRKIWKVGAVVLCTTIVIETVQYFMGRSADIDDVIMNFAGGLLGYGIFKIFSRIFGQKKWWNKAVNLER